MQTAVSKQELNKDGFTIVDGIYTSAEIYGITQQIEKAGKDKPTFRKSTDLFAIRQFLKEIPEVTPLIFNFKLTEIIRNLYGDNYFAVKSIYFDKPGESNWFVAYHQDLTVSVDRKVDIPGYGPWTAKQNQYAVQPPLDILQNNFTIRIHLDNADEHNGALKVITGSHLKGIYRPENIDWAIEQEHICDVKAGGVMLMSPLLLHASNRTTNNKRRRVIHIEFSNAILATELNWSERINF